MVHMKLGKQSRRDVEMLAHAMGVTMTEAVRIAVRLATQVHQARERGATIELHEGATVKQLMLLR
jgi:hypothetical protein